MRLKIPLRRRPIQALVSGPQQITKTSPENFRKGRAFSETSPVQELESYLAQKDLKLEELNKLFCLAMTFLLRDLRPIKGPWTLAGNKRDDKSTRNHNRQILVNYCDQTNRLAKETLKKLQGEDAEKFLDYLYAFFHCEVLLNKKLFPVSFDSANDFTELTSYVLNPCLDLNEEIFLQVVNQTIVNQKICSALDYLLEPLGINIKLNNFPWTATEISTLSNGNLDEDDSDAGLKIEGLNYAFVSRDSIERCSSIYGDSYDSDSLIGHEMTHVILEYLGCDSNRRTFRRYEDSEKHPFTIAHEFIAEAVSSQFTPLIKLYDAMYATSHINFEKSDDFVYDLARGFCFNRGFDIEQIDLDFKDGQEIEDKKYNFQIFLNFFRKNLGDEKLKQLIELIKEQTLAQARKMIIQLKYQNAFDPHKVEQLKNLVLTT